MTAWALRAVSDVRQLTLNRSALNNVHYRYWILDLRVYIRHAPARLRVDAHMFDLALGYAAVYLLRPLWFA